MVPPPHVSRAVSTCDIHGVTYAIQKITGAYADYQHRPRTSNLYVIPARTGIYSVTTPIIKARFAPRASCLQE